MYLLTNILAMAPPIPIKKAIKKALTYNNSFDALSNFLLEPQFCFCGALKYEKRRQIIIYSIIDTLFSLQLSRSAQNLTNG